MTTFMSWSGTRGRSLAEAMCALMRVTIPTIEPWMSTDIRRGTPWASELFARLDRANACVLCLTADSVASPWLAFEAGAVLGASSVDATILRVALDVPEETLRDGCLSPFPLFRCEAGSMGALLQAVGRAERAPSFDGDLLARHWPEFEASLAQIPPLVPRVFDLITFGPAGLFINRVDVDASWTSMLQAICSAEWFTLPEERCCELRYLDIAAERWLPAPSRLSDVKIPRFMGSRHRKREKPR